MQKVEKPRLYKQYDEKIVPALQKLCNISNIMQVPKLRKIVITMGVRDAMLDKKAMDVAMNELYLIAGQKPVITKAKKSIAAFKLLEGMPLGCKVTLRKNMMYEFLDRLINITLPRMRDFKGFKRSQFDRRGNLCFGLKEQIVFPEINYDQIDKIRGMNIVLVTSASNDNDACELLKQFDIPFYK